MAETEYRLDYEGLSYFWNKLKTYIGDQTEEINDKVDTTYAEIEAALEEILGDSTITVAPVDQVPTEGNSSNAISSDAVYTAINTLKQGVITHEDTDTVIASLTPNVLHTWGEITSLTVQALATPTDNTRYNEYMIQFSCGSTATDLDLPQTLTWLGGVQPTTRAGKTYQISIVNNLAVIGEF